MIEDLTTRIIVLAIAFGLLSWGAYETFFNHSYKQNNREVKKT